jgi:hypothetical protein
MQFDGLACQPIALPLDGNFPERRTATDSRVYDEFDIARSKTIPFSARESMKGEVLRS